MNNKNYTRILGSLSLVILAFLGFSVKFYPSWLLPFDETVTQAVRQLYPSWSPFFLQVTRLANPLTIILLFLVVLLLLLYGKRRVEAIWFSSGVIGIAGIANPAIKLVFMRERPTLEHLVTEHSFSFPSGHSAASMVFYGTLICLIPFLIKNPTVQKILQVLLASLILLIGISRIYLGVHFPSDILGGFSLSLTWLLFTYPLFQKNILQANKVKERKKK